MGLAGLFLAHSGPMLPLLFTWLSKSADAGKDLARESISYFLNFLSILLQWLFRLAVATKLAILGLAYFTTQIITKHQSTDEVVEPSKLNYL